MPRVHYPSLEPADDSCLPDFSITIDARQFAILVTAAAGWAGGGGLPGDPVANFWKMVDSVQRLIQDDPGLAPSTPEAPPA